MAMEAEPTISTPSDSSSSAGISTQVSSCTVTGTRPGWKACALAGPFPMPVALLVLLLAIILRMSYNFV